MSKIVLRKAKPQDIPAIVELAVESVSHDPLPVKIDREAMAATATQALNPAHFLWVAEEDGKVVGAVGAMVSPGFWFHKLQCSVMLYYGKAVVPLLREFAKWVKSRSAIKIAVMELEPSSDPRIVKFLQRQGFGRMSTNATYVRSAG